MIEIKDRTNSLISELNKKLNNKCSDFELRILSYQGNMFELCLLENKVCVSYLIINDDNNTFNILSKTEAGHENRGYNKFLTAVSICLVDTMTHFKVLFSSTSVAARIHILSEYNHISKKDEDDEDEDGDHKISVDISEENKKKAEAIIAIWINNKCVKPDLEGGKTLKNRQTKHSKNTRKRYMKRQKKHKIIR